MKSDGTKFFLFLVVWMVLLLELVFFIQGRVNVVFVRSPAFIVFYQIMFFIVPLVVWLGIKRERLADHMPNMKLGSANAVMVLGLSFFLLPFMALLSALSSMVVPNVADNFLGQTQHYSVWMILLAVAVTPAVVEEVVFRGYIQQQYKGWPFWAVALLNGVLFGVIHFSFQQFFYAFIMGIIFAYMVHLTRSIRAAILSHFFMNAFNIVMFRVLTWAVAVIEEVGGYAAEAADAGEAMVVSPWDTVVTVGIVALIFLPFLILLWRAFVSYNRQRFTEYDIKEALKEESPGDISP